MFRAISAFFEADLDVTDGYELIQYYFSNFTTTRMTK